jgi:sulfatase maturation enzyme AslB (radical SAM superfamily)
MPAELLAQRETSIEYPGEEIASLPISLDGPEEVRDRVRRLNGAYRPIGEGIRTVRQRKADNGGP